MDSKDLKRKRNTQSSTKPGQSKSGGVSKIQTSAETKIDLNKQKQQQKGNAIKKRKIDNHAAAPTQQTQLPPKPKIVKGAISSNWKALMVFILWPTLIWGGGAKMLKQKFDDVFRYYYSKQSHEARGLQKPKIRIKMIIKTSRKHCLNQSKKTTGSLWAAFPSHSTFLMVIAFLASPKWLL